MTACENLIGSPRFSPRNISVPFLTWVLSAPSPPMCTCTTTRSACSLAFFTSAWAASMSTTLCDQAYEAKPSTATRTPLTSTTVIWPGAPVCARPALSSACLVCRLPSAPKSYAWLFARFIRRNPASRSSVAYAGGERNAKQVFPADSAEHLPTPVSFVSGCSRLPICRSARRASRTGVKRSFGLLFVLPQYFQAVRGSDALDTGVRLALFDVTMPAASSHFRRGGHFAILVVP